MHTHRHSPAAPRPSDFDPRFLPRRPLTCRAPRLGGALPAGARAVRGAWPLLRLAGAAFFSWTAAPGGPAPPLNRTFGIPPSARRSCKSPTLTWLDASAVRRVAAGWHADGPHAFPGRSSNALPVRPGPRPSPPQEGTRRSPREKLNHPHGHSLNVCGDDYCTLGPPQRVTQPSVGASFQGGPPALWHR